MGDRFEEIALARPFLTAALFPVALAACAATTVSTVTTDAQLALTDGKAILAALEAAGGLPVAVSTDATLVIDGLQAVLTAFQNSTPADTTEQQAVATATAAVKQVMADTTNAQVQAAGQLALTALTAVGSDASGDAGNQAEAALGAVLLDYLATLQPTRQLASAQR